MEPTTDRWAYQNLVGGDVNFTLEELLGLKSLPSGLVAEIANVNQRKRVNLLTPARARDFLKNFARRVRKFYRKYPWAEEMAFTGYFIGNIKPSRAASSKATVLSVYKIRHADIAAMKGEKEGNKYYVSIRRDSTYQNEPQAIIKGHLMALESLDDRRRLRKALKMSANMLSFYI